MVRLGLIAVLVFALTRSAAAASVELVSNGRGDQVLTDTMLIQRTRPLFTATRPAGGTFPGLTPRAARA